MGHKRTAAVVVSGMLIMLTACATGNSSPALSGSTAPPRGDSATAVSSAAAATTSRLTHFPFPASVHFEFQTPLPAAPQDAAAVVAEDDYQLAYFYAIYSDAKDMSVLSYVYSLAKSVRSATFTSVENAKSRSFTGTMRIYDTIVQPRRGGAREVTVSSCYNSTAFYSTDRSTGQILPGQSNAPDQNIYVENDVLVPVNGTWKIVGTSHAYYPHGAAKGCYP
jgi:hypothetical protein